MWIKLFNESTYNEDIQTKFNEAFADFRDSMIDDELYLESDNAVMKKIKGILAKVCPSPDKIKEFFLNYGKKIDAKIQNSKFEDLKKCWNSLKEMALSQDNEEISPEEAGIEPQMGDENDSEEEGVEDNQSVQVDDENGEGEDENENEEVATESLYEEGIWDSIKKGWNSLATPDKPSPRSKKSPTRKSTIKKPTSKKAPLKKATLKKGVQKKPIAKKTTGKKAPAKGKKRNTKQMTAKEKILKFLREHWKQITIVLIAAIAVGLLGAWAGGAFATSSAVTSAAGTLTRFSLPAGMKTLPKGAKLISNGVVRFANGGLVASGDAIDTDDLYF